MEHFPCDPLDFLKESHAAKKTKYKVFCLGWGLLLAIGFLTAPRPAHIAEQIVCWSALGIFAIFFLGMAVELALSLVLRRMHYKVGADKRDLVVVWREGKGNLAFPRKALKRVSYKTDAKTGEGFLGISLRTDLLGQLNPEADKFFDKFRKRYNCEYALTARQIGSSGRVKQMTEFLLRSPGRVRVENTDKIVPPQPKKLPKWLLIACAAMYPVAIYMIWFLNQVPAAK